MRTFGLRRTAERSLSAAVARDPGGRCAAYADGVNAWIARNKLPAQYAAVQVTKVAPWTVGGQPGRHQAARVQPVVRPGHRPDHGRAGVQPRPGLDGHTAVFQDVFPFAPFNTASPVIDSTATSGQPGHAEPAVQRQHRRVG